MLRPTKVLVPTDFSEYSDKALQQGIDIARQYNAELYLFHVVSTELTRVVADYGIPLEAIDSFESQQAEAALDNMKKQLAKFPKAGGIKAFIEVGKGVVYDEVLKAEKDKGIDLIVIASLGRTGLAKYLIGSVARNVLKNARCPVLLTK